MSDRPIIVSACLAGINCRYDGGNKKNEGVVSLVAEGKAIPVCPEQLGGLPTPREKAEYASGDGKELLEGRGSLLTESGLDVSDAFIQGSKEVERLAKEIGAKRAILCEKSPACGPNWIWRQGVLTKGEGVCAAVLRQAGLTVEAPAKEEND